MITWIKRKHYENKVLLTFYRTLSDVLDKQHELLSFLSRLYTSCKDIPVEELKDEFIVELARIVHEAAVKEQDT